MIHQRQGLPLGIEAGNDTLGIHAQLDDFQGHPAADGVFLLGHVNDAAATFADLLQQFVRPDVRAQAFQGRRHLSGRLRGLRTALCAQALGQLMRGRSGQFEKTVGVRFGGEEGIELFPERRLAVAGQIKKRLARTRDSPVGVRLQTALLPAAVGS